MARLLTLAVMAALVAVAALAAAGADYYKVLGVARNAELKDIKRAYRDLSKKYHPDKNPGNQDAADTYVKIAEAYDVLSDDDKRRIYDQHGEEGLKQHTQQGSGFQNPFESFFNFGGNRQQGQARGPDIVLPITVTLEELYTGSSFSIEVNRRVICDHCRGSGAHSERDVETCSACGGRGMREVRQQVAPGFFMQQQIQCNVCGGRGKIVKKQCQVCHGTKVRRGTAHLTIEIERGMHDGKEIVFERQADQTPDITPGDVRFVVRQQPHRVFTRQGDNLTMRMVLSLEEALLGFRREVTHLDGHTVVVERTDVTQQGNVILIENEGMPRHNYPSERGALFVEFHVVFPVVISEKQRQELRRIFANP